MPAKKRARKQTTKTLEEPVAQRCEDSKTEEARRLMEGEGVEKDEAKAISILEELVASGDTEAMLLLAEYCAFGRGMEQNKERAETLISEAATKKNKEAAILMKAISEWKGDEDIDLIRLFRKDSHCWCDECDFFVIRFRLPERRTGSGAFCHSNHHHHA